MDNRPNYLEKPLVVEKLRRFHSYVKKNNGEIGTKQRGIELNFNNLCNFRCKHCFTNSHIGEGAKEEMPIEKVADLANQADELGMFEFDLQGGELTLRPEKLYETIEAIKPDRFYLYVTTNGYKFDKAIAEKLAGLGVSRLSVSIDSLDSETHDGFRGKKNSLKRALDALDYAQTAGMSAYMNITVGHYNAFSEDFEELLKYSKDKGYTTLLNVACPSGAWKDNENVMVDDKDKAHLIRMRKKYKNIFRNIWNPFDRNHEAVLGCNTVNRLYVTPIGDVLVCPYVHIKIGNIYENSLKEISEFGFSIKRFRNYSSKCLAGEDKEFNKKYMRVEGQSIFNPVLAEQIFSKDDFVQ
jgi:MoaA/NifB/PqqE/SkfB family radical SAM enzyme